MSFIIIFHAIHHYLSCHSSLSFCHLSLSFCHSSLSFMLFIIIITLGEQNSCFSLFYWLLLLFHYHSVDLFHFATSNHQRLTYLRAIILFLFFQFQWFTARYFFSNFHLFLFNLFSFQITTVLYLKLSAYLFTI